MSQIFHLSALGPSECGIVSALGCQKWDFVSVLGSIFNCSTTEGKNLSVGPLSPYLRSARWAFYLIVRVSNKKWRQVLFLVRAGVVKPKKKSIVFIHPYWNLTLGFAFMVTIRKQLNFSEQGDLSQWKMAMFGNSLAKKLNAKSDFNRISTEFSVNWKNA